MNFLVRGCLSALLLMPLCLVHAAPIEFSDARIIQPPPGAKVAAAYFSVHNNRAEPLIITGASSEAIPAISIHLSAVVDDVAKMIHQDSVTVEAETSLDFKHGSYHLMLMGLDSPLEPGSMLAFEIETSAGVIPIMIPIITPDEASSMQPHSMNHEAMDMDDSSNHKNKDRSAKDMQHSDMNTSKSMEKN